MRRVLEIEQLRYRRRPDASGQPPFEISVETLSLGEAEVIGVVGPSGCGKSTLIDLVALLRRPTGVACFALMDHDVAALWRSDSVDACTGLRAAHIGIVLQTGGLLPSLSVLENTMLSQRLLGAPDRDHALALLSALDLAGLETRLPSQLSIGQRQRVAIARALAHKPAVVLADEPTASLGVEHAADAMDLLLSLAAEHGAALMIVSHDTELLVERHVPLLRCVVRDDVVHVEAA